MAQHVGYYEDYVLMTEGPFVVVNVHGYRIHGYRIEVDSVRGRRPKPVALAIWDIFDAYKFDGTVVDQDRADRMCDRLNRLVREGLIIYDAAADEWVPIDGWRTPVPRDAPSWRAFQQRMNMIAHTRGVPAPFAGPGA